MKLNSKKSKMKYQKNKDLSELNRIKKLKHKKLNRLILS